MTKAMTCLSCYGIGGRNCPCCGPAPRDRKSFDRMVKRREKQLYKKEVSGDIDDFYDNIREEHENIKETAY